MTFRIKNISIHKFRGIVDTNISLESKNLLLKGDNGTGKSSIVDAFEYFFTGDLRHISEVKGMSIKQHAPHVNFSSEDIKIEIEFNEGINLLKTYKEDPNPPSMIENYFTIAREQKFILRRFELLKFIIQTPGNKFKAIVEMIGIEDLEKVDEQLRLTFNDYSNKLEKLQSDYKKVINSISKLMDATIVDEDHIFTTLNSTLVDNMYPKLSSLDDLGSYIKENFRIVIQMGESFSIKKILNEIILLSGRLYLEEQNFKKAREITSLRQNLQNNIILINRKLQQFLKIGLIIFEDKTTNLCPFCEQAVDPGELINRLKDRISEFEPFSKEMAQLDSSIDYLKASLEELIDNITTILKEIPEFEDLKIFKLSVNTMVGSLKSFISKYLDKEDIISKVEVEQLEHINKDLLDFSQKLREYCTTKNGGVGMTVQEEKGYKIFSQLNGLQLMYMELKKVEKEKNKTFRRYDIAKNIYTTFTETKKDRINEVFQSLKDDIRSFYMYIHPDDPHKNIDLMLDPKKRASIILTIDSFDKENQDPRAFTSEGHLDSLGICIFLAFVKKFNEGLPLIVLDDVITTVDANHREQLAKLLLTEFLDHQLIITTHDGIWYKQLCENQQAFGVKKKYCNMSIIDWDINCGPGFAEYKNLWEKVIECFNRGDFDVAGFLTRRYMEWVLKEICLKMRAQIEFKTDGRYTVEELFISAHSRMKRLCSRIRDNDIFKNAVLHSFKELESWKYMGNLLSHENPEIDIIPTSEIRSFAEKVHNLYQKFLCDNCGSFLYYKRNLKEIRCPKLSCPNPLLIKLN